MVDFPSCLSYILLPEFIAATEIENSISVCFM